MIARLTGTILEVLPGYVVLDVQGVGYMLAVTGRSTYQPGTTASLFTHLAVRENALDLYGFETRDELSVFHSLIKIPKIGPKTALQILSQTDIETLSQAVATEDPAYLAKMSGIGKKSAEKIVSGLRDILGDDHLLSSEPKATVGGDADVIDALVALGYPQRDALAAVQQITPDVVGTKERIKAAFKYLSL
jgi:Holliday junction DNA helicase RuvA